MAKDKKRKPAKKVTKLGRIGMRTAEALVEGELDYLCAEPELSLIHI